MQEEVLTFYNVVLSEAKGRASIVRGDVKRRFIIQGAATAMQVNSLLLTPPKCVSLGGLSP